MKKLIISIFCLVAAQNTFGHTQEQNVFNALGKIIFYEASIEVIEELDGISNEKKSPCISRLFIAGCKDGIKSEVKNLDSMQRQKLKNQFISDKKLALGEILEEGLEN